MTNLYSFLFIITLVLGCSTGKMTHVIEKEWSFTKHDIEGWSVYFEDKVIKDIETFKKTKQEFEKSLHHLVENLPPKNVKIVQAVPFWVSNEDYYPFRANEKFALVYHRSHEWLANHHLPGFLDKGVHLINPKTYFNDNSFLQSPYAIFHLLAHVFYYECKNFDKVSLEKAFAEAKKMKKYELVSKKGSPDKVQANAIASSQEYFAELSETYYGENDLFPHNKAELKKFDPLGYKTIEEAWNTTCQM